MINETIILEKLKRSHDIADDAQNELLLDIIEDVQAEYVAIAKQYGAEGIVDIPEEHSFIIKNVASIQYVRRGSEGLETEKTDFYNVKFDSPSADFLPYIDIITSVFINENGGGLEPGPKEGQATFY